MGRICSLFSAQWQSRTLAYLPFLREQAHMKSSAKVVVIGGGVVGAGTLYHLAKKVGLM
jgi:lysine/ornithine N-monooxygenase